jgi:hypothetical protein
MEIVDSIRDVDVVEVPEEGKEIIVQEESAMSAIEVRRASEIEQNVREQTGLKPRALARHPDGLKQDGDDGKDHIFGKAYTRVRKTKPAPGGVTYTRPLPREPLPEDVTEVEVYFGYRGQYIKTTIRSDLTHEDAERQGMATFDGNVCLTDFHPPSQDTTYRFKATYCRDRDNATWINFKRSDTADEEWVLFGDELSDGDITKIMEDRWFVPLKKIKTVRPLENN